MKPCLESWKNSLSSWPGADEPGCGHHRPELATSIQDSRDKDWAQRRERNFLSESGCAAVPSDPRSKSIDPTASEAPALLRGQCYPQPDCSRDVGQIPQCQSVAHGLRLFGW